MTAFSAVRTGWRWLTDGWVRRSILLLAVFLFMLNSFQRLLIYHPHRMDEVRWDEFGWNSGACQSVEVRAADQTVLHGWLILADGHMARTNQEFDEQLQRGRLLILYFCGNGGHRGYRQPSLRTLTGLGCDVLICDHRGYGDNQGSPTEKHLIADAHAIWNYARETRHVPADRIVILGESLGGGVATGLASELCAVGTEPGGLILQSTFPSLVAAGKVHFPWLPVGLLLIDRFPSAERILKVTCPVLQIHGRRDTIIPWNLGETLYAAIPAMSANRTPKSRIELPETDHNDVFDFNSPDRILLVEGLREFLGRLRHDGTDSF